MSPNAIPHTRRRIAGLVNTELEGYVAVYVTANSTPTEGKGQAAGSFSYSHTVVSGSNQVLVVGVSTGQSDTCTGVKWGGSGGTSLTAAYTGGGGGTTAHVSIYYLLAPTVQTADIYVTLSASNAQSASGAIAFINVNQTSPFSGKNTTTGASATSVNVTSVATSKVFGVQGWWNTDGTPGADQTLVCYQNIDGAWRGYECYKDGTTTTTISRTGITTTYATLMACSIDVV
jgi:hypothetical protein